MTIAAFAALIAFLFLLAYSPGPGNTFFAAIGASQGLRAPTPALVGYHTATFVATALIGFGLGATVLANPIFVTALSAAGSLYVLWLAFTFIRAARSRSASPESAVHAQPKRNISVWSGAIVLLMDSGWAHADRTVSRCKCTTSDRLHLRDDTDWSGHLDGAATVRARLAMSGCECSNT